MNKINNFIRGNIKGIINFALVIILLEIFILFAFIYGAPLALSIITFIIVILTFFDIYPKIMDWTIFKPNLVIENFNINQFENQIKITINNNGEATAYKPQYMQHIISNKDGDVVAHGSIIIPNELIPNKRYERNISTKSLKKSEHYTLRFILVDKEYLYEFDL